MADIEDAKGGIRVDLAGGYVSLRLDVNLSTLTDADRRFVLDILHRVVSRANQNRDMTCENCGKTMADHDALAHCWGPESKTFTPALIDGCPDAD